MVAPLRLKVLQAPLEVAVTQPLEVGSIFTGIFADEFQTAQHHTLVASRTQEALDLRVCIVAADVPPVGRGFVVVGSEYVITTGGALVTAPE